MAGADVGVAFLSAFLQVLFDRLAPKHVVDFIRGRDIEKEFKRLKTTWARINVFLNDAENKQYKNQAVKDWLDELKDVAHDAEDLIDEVATDALLMNLESELSSLTISNQAESSSILDSFRDFSLGIFEPKRSTDIESNIKEIRESFDQLAKGISDLGLEEITSRSSSSSVSRETSSVVDESSTIYGRKVDKRKIIKRLLKEESTGNNNKFSVIPIVGMGGVGKTTLAQLVYNDNRVQNHFNRKAWVCVSDTFDIKRITKDILNSVTLRSENRDDLDSLQVGVRNALNGMKFLIVLDDYWNTNYGDWDTLKKPFGVGAAGSAIIVTTRDREVASNMRVVDPYHLEQLSNDDCWNVFAQHAFGITGVDPSSNLVDIGKKIAMKCKGLPLAAKSLGGLLFCKEEFEWENVLNSNIWDLPEDKSDILPVLKLSYYHLPSHLKRCFTYCSIFPNDYEFEEEEVVLLWMAEGFLQQPNENMELEDFGRKCFRDLLSMSFFQPSSSGNKRCFVMHDLMSDLAVWAAGKTCFRLKDLSDKSAQCSIPNKVRHLSYIRDGKNSSRKFEAFYGVDRLRTFLPLNINGPYNHYYATSMDFLLKFKFFRVLSLAGYCITELPNSIGDLKHLRYLDLSNTTIKSLPESVSTMCNLQTLLLWNCPGLRKLPKEFQNLISLRHLDISNVPWTQELLQQIGRLTSLRRLSDFVVVNDSKSGIGELMNLKHLGGELRISKLENVNDAQQARNANLGDKKGLNVLKMKWCSEFDERRNESVEKEVLDMLRPHKNLKELTIKYYGGVSFPTWIGHFSFSNMVFLNLVGCEKCTDLPPLGQLALLKDLYISGMNGVENVGPEFYGEGCFPSLETLCFADMHGWMNWSLPHDVEKHHNLFARLCEISITNCPNLLRSLPDRLPSLEKLEVRKCEKLIASISSLPKRFIVEIGGYCQFWSLPSPNSIIVGHVSTETFPTEGLIKGSNRVEYLTILYCDELVSLWPRVVSLIQHLTLLRRLEIRSCENLEILKGLHNLTSLTELTIKNFPRLESFPERILPATLRQLYIEDCNALKSVSEAISWHNYSNNSSLEYLSISSCHSLTSIARASLFSTVKALFIRDCQSLESLVKEEDDDGASSSSSSSASLSESRRSLLESLTIWDCPSLRFLFSSSREELPSTLKTLDIRRCPKLGSIGESLHNNSSLEEITIADFESLVRFPDGGFSAANLRKLHIYKCKKLEAMPNRMHDLTSLQQLTIKDCPGMVSFPEEGLPNNITSLDINNPKIYMLMLEWGLHRLSSLRSLSIYDLNMVTFPAEEEIRMVLPSSLTFLRISDFPNLESLSSKGFQNLTSLETLRIRNCPQIKSLPEKGLLPSLLELRIDNCPLLKQRCIRGRGQEWPKISHVPRVDGLEEEEEEEEEEE